jgi:hypothetical protein
MAYRGKDLRARVATCDLPGGVDAGRLEEDHEHEQRDGEHDKHGP